MTAPDPDRDTFELESRFVIVPLWLMARGVSSRALHVYALLYSLADRDTRVAWPSRRYLADHLGVSPSSVDKPVRELMAAGAITRRARYDSTGAQRSSVYVVHSVPNRAPTQPAGTPHPTGSEGPVDDVLPLSTPTQPAGTPHPTGSEGPTQPAGQISRTTYLDTYRATEVTTEAAGPCEHGEPDGSRRCALCRKHARARKTLADRPDRATLDPRRLAAGEREDEDR